MNFWVFLSLIMLVVSGCKFSYSPYTADTPSVKLNRVNIDRIKELESTTGSNFKVAVIADTHNYFSQLDKLISVLNNTGPYAFVIVAGDVTNLGLLEEFDESRRFFNKLKYPYVVAQGNHDLLSNGDDVYRKMYGNNNFSFEFKGAQFVIFNNNNWESAGSIPDIQWVENALASSAASNKILVAHISPLDKKRFTQTQQDEWSALVDMFNVRYFINGHDHNPVQSTFGNAIQITVGAPSKKAYLELIFSAGGVTHQAHTY